MNRTAWDLLKKHTVSYISPSVGSLVSFHSPILPPCRISHVTINMVSIYTQDNARNYSLPLRKVLNAFIDLGNGVTFHPPLFTKDYLFKINIVHCGGTKTL